MSSRPRVRDLRPPRPAHIECRCGTRVTVAAHGPVPAACGRCRKLPKGGPRQHRTTPAEAAAIFARLDREQVIWAAGLFEGEGSVTMTYTPRDGVRPRAVIQLTSTDRDVIDRFAAVWGFGTVLEVDDPRPNCRRRWTYTVGGFERVRVVLEAMLPWLGERRSAKVAEVIAHAARRADATTEPHVWSASAPRIECERAAGAAAA
jgi:hypothetical protein